MKKTPKRKTKVLVVVPDPKKLIKRLGYGDYQQDPLNPFNFLPPKDRGLT